MTIWSFHQSLGAMAQWFPGAVLVYLFIAYAPFCLILHNQAVHKLWKREGLLVFKALSNLEISLLQQTKAI